MTQHSFRARACRGRGLRAVAQVASLLILAACKDEAPKKEPPPAPPPATAAAPSKPAPPPPPKPAPQLQWDDPAEWKRVKPSSSMRRASYEIPPAKGDKEPGELNVFVLGGEVEDNIKRWVAEFSGFDEKTLVRSDRTVNDMTQAVVHIPKGKFSGGMGTSGPKENYSLLGAIVVTPPGAKYFFKLTGPAATIKAAHDPFYKMLDSMRMEGSAPAAKPAAAETGTTAPAKAESPPTSTGPAKDDAKPAAAPTAPAPSKK